MKYSKLTSSWAIWEPKTAALYFEKARILPSWLPRGQDELEELLQAAGTQFDSLVTFLDPGLFILGEASIAMQEAMVKKLLELQGHDFPNVPVDPANPNYEAFRDLWILGWALHTGVSGDENDGTLVIPADSTFDDPEADPLITLTGLQLVDVSKLSWEQILEIRRDEEAAQQLRRLRLFLMDEHSDSDPNYLRDLLLQRIDDFEKAAKRLGAETTDASLSLLLGKEMQVSGAATVAAALLGQPVAALVASVPILAQLGKIGIEIRKKRRETSYELGSDPVAFIADLRSKTAATD